MRPRRTTLVCLALIAAHLVFLFLSALNNSVTYDEFAHLAAGCAYWRWQELSVYNQSPPLLRLIGSWPAMLAGVEVPDAAKFRKFAPKDRHWFFAAAFERANAKILDARGEPRVDTSGRFQRLVVLGRLGMIPLSCLGAWLVFLWARRLYGEVAGLAACALWTFNPDVIAHGSIVGTDLGSAVAMLLALLLWQRFLDAPRPARAVAASIAMAAAHLCKLNAIVLWPAMLAMLLVALWDDRTRADRPTRYARQLWTGLLIAIVSTWLGLNLGYGFDRSFERLENFDFTSRPMIRLRDALPRLPAPLPRQLLLGADAQAWEFQVGGPAYLLGEHYTGRRWAYYPVALAVKLPLGVIGLFALAALSARLGMRLRGEGRAEAIGIAVAMLAILAPLVVGSGLNIGVRYLLPAYALAVILTARLWRRDAPRTLVITASLLLGVAMIESAVVCPRYLTFFNALAGGSTNGWRIVNDSNADWGQGLLDLRRWMRDHHESRITLAYFGKADPGAYGIDYATLADHRGAIETPYVAVSVYYLAGLPQRMPEPGAEYSDVVRLSYYMELQAQRPVEIVGNVFHVFTREQVEQARRAHGMNPSR